MSQQIFPALVYRDAHAAIDWLERAFGFERIQVHEGDNGTITHAELRFREGVQMLGDERNHNPAFGDRVGQAWLYLVVEDPDAHYERAKAAGAEIIMELTDTDYGSRDYSARDPEGNLWSFGTYAPES